jgi:hypothetical protein
VVWQEEKAPDVVIELLSESTAQYDKTEKMLVYQDKMRISEYFWYDPWNAQDFAGFNLNHGQYEPKLFNERGWLISESLGLALLRWSGRYRNVEATWLRWATLAGDILLTGQELARQERQRADQERQRADQERHRAELLADKLREMGFDPDQL